MDKTYKCDDCDYTALLAEMHRRTYGGYDCPKCYGEVEETTSIYEEALSVLSTWEKIAHDSNSGFTERFCPEAWILVWVAWDSENMRMVYIVDSGQHISDSVKITEWLEFITKKTP